MRWLDRLAIALAAVLVAGGCAKPTGEALLTDSRDGWRRVGPVLKYGPENLYDHINGEADCVIRFGFRSLASAQYRSGDETECGVDLYDVGSASNAFALFRSRADIEAKPLDVGSEGVGDETRAEFWQGRFYVDVNVFSPAGGFDAPAMARGLAKSLPATKAWPAYLKLLPARARVARSEQYLPRDFLGHEFLIRTVTARYTLGGREVALFACRYETPALAAEALGRFEAVLRRKPPTGPLALGERGLLAQIPDMGRLAVFRRGCFVGGMTGYADTPAVKALLVDLDRLLGGP